MPSTPSPLTRFPEASASVAGVPVVLAAHRLRKSWTTGPDHRFVVEAGAITLGPGGHIALVGPSGSGKSTVLDMLALALQPDTADIFQLTDRTGRVADVGDMWRGGRSDRLAALRRDMLGYVLQTGGLLPFLSVRENIALPLRLIGRDDDDAVDALAERLGLADRMRLPPAALSVGERQRAAIARALVHRPAIVIADEPTASVDQANAERIFALFAELINQTGVAAVVATHDRALAEAFGLHVLHHELVDEGDTVLSRFRMAPT